MGAINAKHNNYEMIEEKVKYNMKMLHKASLSGILFSIFISNYSVNFPNHEYYVTSHMFLLGS